MIAILKSCVRYRELVVELAKRELQSRYQGSVIGRAWLVVQPAIFLAIYYVIFAEYFGRGGGGVSLPPEANVLAMFCGLAPWLAFSEALSGGSRCFLGAGSLIKKYAFPCEVLAAQTVLVSMIHTVINLTLLALAVAVVMGQAPRFVYLVPILVLLQSAFCLGLVLLLGSLAVYVRDILNMLPLILTAGFFLSPIFMFARSPSLGGELAATVLRWNPMTYLIASYRDVFIWRPHHFEKLNSLPEATREGYMAKMALATHHVDSPPWREVGIFALIAFGTLWIGVAVFRAGRAGFADEI